MDEQNSPGDDLKTYLQQIQEVSDRAVEATQKERHEAHPTETLVDRQVTLRDERAGSDSRHLWAYTDAAGRLHIDGQDLGPGTASVSSDGEYEWFETFAEEDVPRVVALLGGQPDEHVLDVLERWSGRSYELTRLLRDSGIPREFFSC